MVNPENGWYKDEEVVIFHENQGWVGDDQIGDGYSTGYYKQDSEWRAEINYYVTATDVHEEDARYGTYGVEQQILIWRDIGDGEQADLEIDYDYGDVRCFPSESEANLCAKRLADMNWSHIFNV